jgi:hypothetical protein
MHTLLVIGVFAAMVLAPCLVASYSNLFAVRVPDATENPEPEVIVRPVRVPPAHESQSPLSDPTVTRTR